MLPHNEILFHRTYTFAIKYFVFQYQLRRSGNVTKNSNYLFNITLLQEFYVHQFYIQRSCYAYVTHGSCPSNFMIPSLD